MSDATRARITRAAGLLAVSASALLLALYVAVALQRLRHPYELEWMEGAVVDHVRRVLAGEKLYVAPSLAFVPFIYAPLYYYVAAAVAALTGVGFFPLRLVSFASSLGVFALLYAIVRRETGRRELGLVAAGLFAATYRVSGAWFDVARVDSLFLLLLLAGVHALRSAPGGAGGAVAGVFLALSFLTKQTALTVAAPLLVWAIWDDRRRGLAAAAVFAGVTGGSVLVLDALHGGWFRYYVLDLPRAHRWVGAMWLGFWTGDLRPVALALGLAAVAVWRATPRARWFHLAALAGAVGSSWLSRLHEGGFPNVVMPAYAVIALTAACGLATLGGSARAAALAATVIQLALLWYPPAAQVPPERDRAAGDALVARLRQIEGEVWMPSHGYLPAMAGKPTHAHAQAIEDVLRAPPSPVSARLRDELATALRAGRFGAVVLDSAGPLRAGTVELGACYRDPEPIFDDPGVFHPVAGFSTRPAAIALRR